MHKLLSFCSHCLCYWTIHKLLSFCSHWSCYWTMHKLLLCCSHWSCYWTIYGHYMAYMAYITLHDFQTVFIHVFARLNWQVVGTNIPPVRPRVPRSACSNELYYLMERCWEEVPVERPTFSKIKDRLKKVIGSHSDNIVDVLFKRMEQYAMDLEVKVAEKTQQFMDEKNRSEQLLSQLLPK